MTDPLQTQLRSYVTQRIGAASTLFMGKDGVFDEKFALKLVDEIMSEVQAHHTKTIERLIESLPKEELSEPSLRQYEPRGSAPFFCSLCGMGEMTLMERKEDDRYYCHCSYWSDPHNAYLDSSGGNWLGWFDKDAAQKILDSQPTLTIDQVTNLLRGELDK